MAPGTRANKVSRAVKKLAPRPPLGGIASGVSARAIVSARLRERCSAYPSVCSLGLEVPGQATVTAHPQRLAGSFPSHPQGVRGAQLRQPRRRRQQGCARAKSPHVSGLAHRCSQSHPRQYRAELSKPTPHYQPHPCSAWVQHPPKKWSTASPSPSVVAPKRRPVVAATHRVRLATHAPPSPPVVAPKRRPLVAATHRVRLATTLPAPTSLVDAMPRQQPCQFIRPLPPVAVTV